MTLSRRGFVSGLATALGYAGVRPDFLFAQTRPTTAAASDVAAVISSAQRGRVTEYDAMAKLANNENPWGPLPSVMDGMEYAWKYAGRYGYPDGGLVDALARHHGVKPENILLGAGSSEILIVMALAFLENGRKKVVGVEPTYATVYQRATQINTEAIRLPLQPDGSQSIPAFIEAAQKHAREIGFLYLCNPNNPTGMIVTRQEVKQLLDGIPRDMPVMIDEAYHHFVDSADYASAVPYVIEGRPVVVARTFSKIFGIAGMRLGYAVAPPELIARMAPHAVTSINAIVKWGAVAGLADEAGQRQVKVRTLAIRDKAIADIRARGHDVLPSQANFFMVSIGRDVQPVIDEFRTRGVLVGRPFPPMTTHLRVSVGTEAEMSRFTTAFNEIFPARRRG
jgi:histidinol-phosphate aminotransferase